MNGRYSLAELQSLPDLLVGQADTLKVETPGFRVWLSRCTVADGEPFDNAVTLERWRPPLDCLPGEWQVIERYPAE